MEFASGSLTPLLPQAMGSRHADEDISKRRGIIFWVLLRGYFPKGAGNYFLGAVERKFPKGAWNYFLGSVKRMFPKGSGNYFLGAVRGIFPKGAGNYFLGAVNSNSLTRMKQRQQKVFTQLFVMERKGQKQRFLHPHKLLIG